jgi:hypothetical protein
MPGFAENVEAFGFNQCGNRVTATLFYWRGEALSHGRRDANLECPHGTRM